MLLLEHASVALDIAWWTEEITPPASRCDLAHHFVGLTELIDALGLTRRAAWA